MDLFKVFYTYGKEFNCFHLDRVADVTDWIGFTDYMGEMASPLALRNQGKRMSEDASDLGWPMAPKGLTTLIRKLARRYKKPLIIMENGIADRSDLKRQRYLREHIEAVRLALAEGHDLRGYLHWSLIDNYEWAFGYAPKFGLYAIDENDLRLTPKPSAHQFRTLIGESRKSPLG